MKNLFSMLLLSLAVLAFAACGDKKDNHGDHDHDHDHEHADGDHDHDHDHDGDDHDHDHDDDDDHADMKHTELGKSKAGDYAVSLMLIGEIEANHEAIFDIEVHGEHVHVVRAWVGIESAKGSRKAKINGKEGKYHGHVDVPATIPAGSTVWIEVENDDGKKTAASFKY